jgi:CheY-like chemotaxis protein/CheY-specific phosphatase CheX
MVKWILVVDDEEDILEIVSRFIEINFGDKMKIVTARDGIEATHKLAFQAFDCILTDLHMPRKEGAAFVDSAKQSPLNANTPIVVISGSDPTELTKKYKHIQHLKKPINSGLLVDCISTQLKLGPTDQRMEAHLLNGFVESVKYFVNKIAHIESEAQKPMPKKSGDTVSSEVVHSILVQSGKSGTEFVLGFEKETLKEISKSVMESGSEVKYEKIVAAASSVVLKRTVAECKGKVKIQSTHSYIKSEGFESEFKRLEKAKGITIPLTSQYGEMFIHALW